MWSLSLTSNKYWMSNPSKYMNDSSYLKINYSNVKCGQGPLMKHNENYSPYNNSGTVWIR